MRRVWLAIVVASLGWGTAGVATRSALNEGVTPYRLASYRSLFAVAAVIAYLALAKRGFPGSSAAWKVGIMMGISNLALPFTLSTIALQYASAGFLGLMTALIPIVTAVIAHVMLPNEPISSAKAVGLLVGLAGVAVLLLSGDSGLGEGGRPVVAGILGLAAVISIAAGGVYAKRHAGQYEPVEVTGVHFATGTLVIAIAALVAEGGPAGETGRAWLLLVYMAVASTFIPFVLYYWTLRKVSATYASMAGYVVPIIAVVAGVVLLGELLQPGLVVGGILILVGVVVTDRAERHGARRPAVVD